MRSLLLGEIIKSHGGLIQTGPFGAQLHQHEYQDSGIPVVMPKDIKDGRINEESVARISDQKASELSRHRLKRNSIIFPRRGEISKCALISEKEEGFLCGTGCLKIELPAEVLDPKFLSYYLGLRQSVEWLERNAVGTTMLNLNTKILGRMPIPDVDIRTQKAIADILSAYDDLIENNRRRMALLEESARLLYREWFVHLRFPGHEHVPITDGAPEGWERKFVPDIIEINPRERPEKGNMIRYIPMSALSESGMTADAGKFEDRERVSGTKFRNGDTLLARITPCLENGKTAFVNFLGNEEIACGSTEFIVLRGRVVSPYFVYCLARTHDFRENAIKSMIGSSGRQRVQNSCFEEFLVPLPPQFLLDSFDEAAEPCFREIDNLQQQNRALGRARDILLPRLMNGELAV